MVLMVYVGDGRWATMVLMVYVCRWATMLLYVGGGRWATMVLYVGMLVGGLQWQCV